MDSPNLKKLAVTFDREFVVKASCQFPEVRTLALSNLDLLSGRFPITYVYLYTKPLALCFDAIVDSLKTSLAETLNYFYPFGGRIVQNHETDEPRIVCDNKGALLVEARANIELKGLNFYNLDEFINAKLISTNPDFASQVQVTQFACGGVSVTFTFDHALGDATSFGKFLRSWSEVSRRKPLSCFPDHRRNLPPRSPPTYNPFLDQTFVKCSLEEIKSIPRTKVLMKRLYHIDVSSIKRLQELACTDGQRYTKIEAFSAYLWKLTAMATDRSSKICKMGWMVDGRGRLCGRDEAFSSSYIGNILSVAIGEASPEQLNRSSVAEVTKTVHNAIMQATSEAHFRDLIDWVECHRPGLMLTRVALGLDGPAMVLSSGRNFPVAELDFGFGGPVLGTVCSTVESIGVGYMNQRYSAKGDGSWIVSAILWPELAAALELDSVFQPMSVSYIQL